MILASDQIKKYEQDGVIIIRDIFKPWINTLREGFEKVLKKPSPHARENINKGDIITENSFTAKRTGGKGVSAADYYKLLNSRAKRKFKINHIIKI